MKNTGLFLLLPLVLLFCGAGAQPFSYTAANAHSHNDYENKFPFTQAYDAQFGSIEADVFLWHDSLIIGHTESDIPQRRTLEKLYLDPLQEKVRANHGYAYVDTSRSLQLLIDIKTGSGATLKRLIDILNKYPVLTRARNLRFVITGNRPGEAEFRNYPFFIWFDGEMDKHYSSGALKKIALFSSDLTRYSSWDGKGTMPEKDVRAVNAIIQKIHRLNKTIRFWNAPDFSNAWSQFMHAGVDYINTDHIEELATFLGQQHQHS